ITSLAQRSRYENCSAPPPTTEYNAVFVENLNVKSMLEENDNARNKAEVGWRDFITILKHHGRKNACHVVDVEPRGTTKECAECSVETAKPLWVREHSCPSCGFETDRDWNAALNVKSRGLEKLGVVHSKGTPVKTATAVDTRSVSASRVVETGSPCLKEAAKAAE
ncbi:transposase, partial [Natronoglomus mannanivorans]|nr:zinc ribbon domain-containing protein [Halobacteria archaeon AArc-xg1-1]